MGETIKLNPESVMPRLIFFFFFNDNYLKVQTWHYNYSSKETTSSQVKCTPECKIKTCELFVETQEQSGFKATIAL